MCQLPIDELHQLVPETVIREVALERFGAIADETLIGASVSLKDRTLLPLLKALKRGRSGSSNQDPVKVKWIMRAVAAHLLDRYVIASAQARNPANTHSLSRRQLQVLADYVQSRLAGDIQTEDLARELGLSRAQFARRFKVATGTSPHQYVLDKRVHEAKRLLAESGRTIAEIALKTGFAGPSHITAVFRRLVRLSPSEYRSFVAPGPVPARASIRQGDERSPRQVIDLPDLPRVESRVDFADGASSTGKLTDIHQRTVTKVVDANVRRVHKEGPLNQAYRIEETPLRLHDRVRLVRSSQDLGWVNLFAAITDELPHESIYGASPSIWLATTATPADIRRLTRADELHLLMPHNLVSAVPPGEPVTVELGLPVRAMHIFLRQELVNDVADQLFSDGNDRRNILPLFGHLDQTLQLILGSIRSALNEPPLSNQLKIDYLSHALAAYLLRNHSVIGAAPAVIEGRGLNAKQLGAIVDYIADNLSSDLSVAELSAIVGLRRAQFLARFKATTTASPHQFVMWRRVLRAKQLLMDPKLDYASIALLCGFVSQTHFITIFKRIAGVTPSQFRQALQ